MNASSPRPTSQPDDVLAERLPRAPVTEAPPAVRDAVEQGLGTLLSDRNVTAVMSLEGGMLQVTRRGRRQILDVMLEGPLFALLREQLSEQPSAERSAEPSAERSAERGEERSAHRASLQLGLRGAHTLVCSVLLDGRVALHIVRAPALDASLDELVEEGLLPPGIPDELCAAVAAGTGVLVLGTSRVGRQRVVVALARAAQARWAMFGLTDALGSLLPVPLAQHDDVVLRARAAAALGADGICALELHPRDVAALIRDGAGMPLLASVTSPTVDALDGALDGAPRLAAAAHVAVIGHGPDGHPRLVELHGPPSTGADTAPPSSVAADPAEFGAAMPIAQVEREPSRPAVLVHDTDLGGLPPLEDVPPSWASDSPDDDPGWELAGTPTESPEPGSFDEALAAQRARPAFAPRIPPLHPQARVLQARGMGKDPFGGLTFEPPAGGTPNDEHEP